MELMNGADWLVWMEWGTKRWARQVHSFLQLLWARTAPSKSWLKRNGGVWASAASGHKLINQRLMKGALHSIKLFIFFIQLHSKLKKFSFDLLNWKKIEDCLISFRHSPQTNQTNSQFDSLALKWIKWSLLLALLSVSALPIQFSIYFMALNEINGIEWFLLWEKVKDWWKWEFDGVCWDENL